MTTTEQQKISQVSHNDMANAIRALSMDAVEAANSGHPGMPMGMADVATVLYTKFLALILRNPNGQTETGLSFLLATARGFFTPSSISLGTQK